MKLPRRFFCTTSLVALLLGAGCMSSGTNFDSAKVSQIQKGVTTEADLLGLFGPSNNRGIDSEGNVNLSWTYVESRVKGETFIPYAGPFVGGSKSATKLLHVSLGPDGKVTRFNASDGASESRNTTQDIPKE